MMDHVEYCDALELEVERFAASYDHVDPSLVVPSCPQWSAHDLAAHLGGVHRWAEHLVREVAQQRIPRSELDLDSGPVNAAWLREGGSRLVATLRSADPAQAMWAWGADQHVVFWSRRQLHETFIHRLDLELAMGNAPEIDSVVAEDAVDEFLVNLESDDDLTLRAREHVAQGESLLFRSIDAPRTWNIQLHDKGFRFSDPLARAEVEVSGAAGALVMVLLRRQALNESSLRVAGDASLLAYWLANSAFE